MVDILAHPEQFKAELKDKWLDYYDANRSWLQHLMSETGYWSTATKCEEDLKDDDYNPRRPNSYFLIGVISGLEPKVQGLLSYMGYTTSSEDYIVRALGLDFDPEIELKKRSQQLEQQKSEADSQYLDQIREEIKT